MRPDDEAHVAGDADGPGQPWVTNQTASTISCQSRGTLPVPGSVLNDL